jgi:oxidase EvaA
MTKKYIEQLQFFSDQLFSEVGDKNSIEIEMAFERLFNIDAVSSIQDTLDWYEEEKKSCSMNSEIIPLNECKQWEFDQKTGSFVHNSGEFFRVDGIRVSNTVGREVMGGWEQPILTQVGFDGGILGLIRKRINGVPHYLVEAKAEPGNYNIVQISTTVQATFSNLKQAHKGNITPFSEYFLTPEKFGADVIFDRWMSEDGGRLFNKRNRSMVVEISSSEEIDICNRYRWLTLWQLIELTRRYDAIVAPHIRGILAAV